MKKDPLTAKESHQLKATARQLNWVSSKTRPDISFDSCQVSVSCKDATIEDLFKAKESVKKLKSQHVSLQHPNLGSLKEARIVGYNDAAFANLKDGSSQGGGGVLFFLQEAMENMPQFIGSLKRSNALLKAQ